MGLRHWAQRWVMLLPLVLVSACGSSKGVSEEGAAMVTKAVTFVASDGTELRAFISGAGDYRPRPLIVEFSPYAPTSFSQQFAAPPSFGKSFGPAYNHVVVNARGTGLSSGVWGAVGPRDQQDVSEFLAWACEQPWSNGHIGLYGFSASAIAIYNSMHLPLTCVEAASLMAGSDNLYRDLLYPGGILNLAPAAVVAIGVGGPMLASFPTGLLEGRPITDEMITGFGNLGLDINILLQTVENQYWLDRTQRVGPNNFPVLADTSFYDPEPRGPFESFKLLRSLGTKVHLLAFGAHDGYPAGSPSPFPDFKRWFDHYLLGVNNGVDRDPAVQLLIGNGSQAELRLGNFTRINGSDWPIPGTRWQPLFLDPTRSGTALSLNDGVLSSLAPEAQAIQPYLDLVSLPTATDPDSASTIGAGTLFDALPLLTQLKSQEPLALTYTTPVLTKPVNVVGPASLDVFVTTVLPVSDLYAVLADVWPDGNAYAVGVGRLRTGFPNIDRDRSVIDANGEVVQPYGDYSAVMPALPGQGREYHVEFWPVGNHFAAGHRLRLYLLGTSLFMLPAPGVNLVSIGGATPSRLLLPVLPDSDVYDAMGVAK
ncbi:MAG: CocE/NonD family hydrolase [Pseudomonadota bacterium]